MTCRALSRSTPVAIGLWEPDETIRLHVPAFARKGLTPGMADCLRCGEEISLSDFTSNQPCPGRPTNQGA